jgi:DNA repair ATPase RecN
MPADVSNFLTWENITALGLLLVGIVLSWRYFIRSSEQIRKESEKNQNNLVAEIKSNHEEQKDILQQQLSLLQDQCEGERRSRIAEMNQYSAKLTDITLDYKKALSNFNRSMEMVQETLSEQTNILKEMAGVPQKLDKIEKDVDCLWQELRSKK